MRVVGGSEIDGVSAMLGVPGGALEAAEDRGLVGIENGTLRFRHPLLRAAVYNASTPADADGCTQRWHILTDGEWERRARHLPATATGPDG